jgi:hypothetical protein
MNLIACLRRHRCTACGGCARYSRHRRSGIDRLRFTLRAPSRLRPARGVGATRLVSDEVGPERSLLVLCTAFRGRGDYPNLTVKKIPKQVLSRCEWGHDDYSLQVENLPKAPPHPGPLLSGERNKASPGQQALDLG